MDYLRNLCKHLFLPSFPVGETYALFPSVYKEGQGYNFSRNWSMQDRLGLFPGTKENIFNSYIFSKSFEIDKEKSFFVYFIYFCVYLFIGCVL